jgi:hypothetical protein
MRDIVLLKEHEWDNDSVHPARAVKVSMSKAPDRGLGCNGWFVVFSSTTTEVGLFIIRDTSRAAVARVIDQYTNQVDCHR